MKMKVIAIRAPGGPDELVPAELELRIVAFEGEISRLKAEIAKKMASKAAADAFFKS